jgi:DNA polymerase-1
MTLQAAFNLASPKQLGEMLFDKLGIAGGKKTATGQYATGEAILEQLDHPLATYFRTS